MLNFRLPSVGAGKYAVGVAGMHDPILTYVEHYPAAAG
jgi:hypothetical protein